MEPIAVTVRGKGSWVLIHRCLSCGRLRLNRTAADDNQFLLLRLAALPLTMPPFPIQHPRHDESPDAPGTPDTPARH